MLQKCIKSFPSAKLQFLKNNKNASYCVFLVSNDLKEWKYGWNTACCGSLKETYYMYKEETSTSSEENPGETSSSDEDSIESEETQEKESGFTPKFNYILNLILFCCGTILLRKS